MLSVPTQSLDKWNIIIFYILNRPLTSAITASAAIVAYRPLVPHAVAEILLKQKTAHFSPARLLH